ncbi:MAG TPA: TetR/AcrR family transcriptional regulator [Acidimicrobiales bacterium]|jgi:AcrR family transcriptional regulator|nr:TetR/AcrR family transcriptional regulator [Acidimicrobiales bacterium]
MTDVSAPAGALSMKTDSLNRRGSLLDAAGVLVAAGGAASVSMESVAAASGVSRALVYKHFANRHDVLAALFERESRLLHRQLTQSVTAAAGLEAKFRALVEGALTAQSSRGATLAALMNEGGRPAHQRDVQRRRDGATVRYFAALAVAELGLDERRAIAGVQLALGAIALVLQQWRHRPTPAYAAELADTYVAFAMGGLRTLSSA